MSHYDLILKNSQAVLHNASLGQAQIMSVDIAIHEGKIAEIGSIAADKAQQHVDLKGLTVMPGVIDSQVHFREPGLVHKEDFSSGSLGALLGGVTGVFEMPNTNPPTTDAIALADKCTRTTGRIWTHMGFYLGACAENTHKLSALEVLPGCVGIKVFFWQLNRKPFI